MSTELTQSNSNIAIWDDPDKLLQIKKLYAAKCTDLEFQTYVAIGKATNLNPFLREIWIVKLGKDKNGDEIPAQIFIGRDGYRKAAQSHPEYDYHQSDAVYENDKFEVVNGEVRHSYTLNNRGKLVGAYCVVKRHKASRSQYVFVELDEYSTGKSLWAPVEFKEGQYGQYKVGGKPATMIKKVAESQCLRMGFQDLFGGTYGEEEMQNMPESIRLVEGATQTEKLKNIIDSNVIDAETGEVIEQKKVHNTGRDDIQISEEQITRITFLMYEKGFSDERIAKALEYYKVTELNQLTDAQARVFLLQLEKV